MKIIILSIALLAISRTTKSEDVSAETVISEENFFSGREPSVMYKDELKNETDGIVMKINNKNLVNKMMSENMLAGKVENDHLVDLLKVYDVRSIGKSWNRRSKFLTSGCRHNMHSFLSALDKSELWALKMLDASGRYTTGFFWGNNYWTGSEALCNNVGMKRKHYTSNGNLPRGGMNFTSEENSPFPLGFYKIRVQLKLPKHVSPVRTILIGICAPFSCNEEDMRIIFDMSIADNLKKNKTEVDLVGIRTPHKPYLFWQDKVFWILAGVTSVVSVLLFIGTFYDYYRERRYKLANRSRMPISESYLGNDSGKISNSITQSLTTNKRTRNVPGLNAIHDETTKFDNNSNTLDMNEGSSVNSEPELEMWEKLLSAFSIRENMKTICDHSVGADTIPTIHGLRSLSMAWVILGHTCIVIFKYSDNMEFRTVIEKQFLFQAVNNGAFSVDTFFFISGLLVSFLYFRTTAKIDISVITGTIGLKSNVLQFLGLIAYRYGRLTAPYMFVLGCVQVSMKWFNDNSIFDPPTLDHENCPNYWWRNALYINTLFPVQEMCMLWSWYLADDTQFYVLGIILLIIAVTHIKAAAALLFAFLISSWATTAYVAYINNHMPSEDDPLALFDKIYDKPWTRLGPYLIGMVVGWVLFKTDCKIRMNKFVVILGWLLSLTTLSSLVYGLYDTKLDLITSSAYSSLSHSAWALGLSWVVIACSTGYGGFVNKLLSSSLLYPFSRVTYCAYLIHPLTIRYMIITNDSPLHLNKEVVMFLFFGQVVVSYISSFIISLAFEAPVVSLLRILSPTKASKTVP